MTLNKTGQLYRYFDKYYFLVDMPTDLCQLFWKLVGSMGLIIFTGVLVGSYIFGWFTLFLLSFPYWASMLTLVMTTVGTVIGIIFGGAYIFTRDPVEAFGHIIAEGYRGFKDKYCPLVTWK